MLKSSQNLRLRWGFKPLTVAMATIIGLGLQLPALAENLMMLNIASEPKGFAKTVEARVMIDAPPSLVWREITDYPDLKNILPGYEKSQVVQSSGATKILDIAMKVAAFLPTYKYRVRVQESAPSQKISLTRISGDFKELKATYTLIPQSGGTKTILAYSLELDPGFNLPGSQSIIKNNTERSLKALEKHIEQEARKSLIGQR